MLYRHFCQEKTSIGIFNTCKVKLFISLSVSALDFPENQNVQDAFVIAVEQQARERLERLSALNRIKPVDIAQLSNQVRTCFCLGTLE